jgi:hypothetical protein
MVSTYQITVVGVAVNDWMALRNFAFPGAQPVEETYGGQIGTFTFDTPQIPTDLGPLVKVELISNDPP